MNKWQEAQQIELLFWTNYQDNDFSKNVKESYGVLFDTVIKDLGYDIMVFEGGCGAFSPVCTYPFRYISVMDSLLNQYMGLRNCNLDKANNTINGSLDSIPHASKIFDASFLLNCLDHIDPVTLPKVLSEISRITHKYICIDVDLRPNGKEDLCHPFIFKKEYVVFEGFKLIYEKIGIKKISDIQFVQQIYKMEIN